MARGDFWRWLHQASWPDQVAVGAAFYLAVAVMVWRETRLERRARDQTETWYRSAYPSCAGDPLSCCACFRSRIRVRKGTAERPWNTHVCTGCGESLFYSWPAHLARTNSRHSDWFSTFVSVTPGLSAAGAFIQRYARFLARSLTVVCVAIVITWGLLRWN